MYLMWFICISCTCVSFKNTESVNVHKSRIEKDIFVSRANRCYLTASKVFHRLLVFDYMWPRC